jgi:hypothetical protein
MFQMFGRSEEGVEKTCKMMGLNAEDGPGIESFAQIAGIQAAWSAVRIYQAAEDKTHAENKLMGIPNAMKGTEYTSLKRSFEKANDSKKVANSKLPGVTILERLEGEIEVNEFTAPFLNELPSKEEVEEASKNKNDSLGLAVHFTSSGAKLTQPVRVKLQLPSSTEQFRHRIELLSTAFEFMKISRPASRILATSSKEVWADHIEYILGPRVHDYKIKDEGGRVVKVPSWTLVLNFEHAIRAKACELMNEGDKSTGGKPMDLKNALEVARDCLTVRQEEFIEKLNTQGNNGARSSNQGEQGSNADKSSKQDKAAEKARTRARNALKKEDARKVDRRGGGKLGKGSKGDGKGGKGPKGVKNKLAVKHEGKQICFAFNNGKCTGNCTREHVCQICFGKHSKDDCSSKE